MRVSINPKHSKIKKGGSIGFGQSGTLAESPLHKFNKDFPIEKIPTNDQNDENKAFKEKVNYKKLSLTKIVSHLVGWIYHEGNDY